MIHISGIAIDRAKIDIVSGRQLNTPHESEEKTTRQLGKTSVQGTTKTNKSQYFQHFFIIFFFLHNTYKSKNQLPSHKNNTKRAPNTCNNLPISRDLPPTPLAAARRRPNPSAGIHAPLVVPDGLNTASGALRPVVLAARHPHSSGKTSTDGDGGSSPPRATSLKSDRIARRSAAGKRAAR
jgi:hypothetical protein